MCKTFGSLGCGFVTTRKPKVRAIIRVYVRSKVAKMLGLDIINKTWVLFLRLKLSNLTGNLYLTSTPHPPPHSWEASQCDQNKGSEEGRKEAWDFILNSYSSLMEMSLQWNEFYYIFPPIFTFILTSNIIATPWPVSSRWVFSSPPSVSCVFINSFECKSSETWKKIELTTENIRNHN